MTPRPVGNALERDEGRGTTALHPSGQGMNPITVSLTGAAGPSAAISRLLGLESSSSMHPGLPSRLGSAVPAARTLRQDSTELPPSCLQRTARGTCRRNWFRNRTPGCSTPPPDSSLGHLTTQSRPIPTGSRGR